MDTSQGTHVIARYTVQGAEEAIRLQKRIELFAETVLRQASSYQFSEVYLSSNCRQVVVMERWSDKGEFLAWLEHPEAEPHLRAIKELALGVDVQTYTLETAVYAQRIDA